MVGVLGGMGVLVGGGMGVLVGGRGVLVHGTRVAVAGGGTGVEEATQPLVGVGKRIPPLVGVGSKIPLVGVSDQMALGKMTGVGDRLHRMGVAVNRLTPGLGVVRLGVARPGVERVPVACTVTPGGKVAPPGS